MGDNIRVNLHDFGLGSGFFAMTPEHKQWKKKIDQLDVIQIKNFCASKDIIMKMKRQYIEWEKIFVNHMSSLLFR